MRRGSGSSVPLGSSCGGAATDASARGPAQILRDSAVAAKRARKGGNHGDDAQARAREQRNILRDSAVNAPAVNAERAREGGDHGGKHIFKYFLPLFLFQFDCSSGVAATVGCRSSLSFPLYGVLAGRPAPHWTIFDGAGPRQGSCAYSRSSVPVLY